VSSDLQLVNIRPGVTILSVLRYLNYRPWYAMAEFVDNSLQSSLDYREALRGTEGADFKPKVGIEWDPSESGRIVIRDNAAGIHEQDYPRAFRPAEIPLDRSGLSEFGMGMKSAACWLAKNWEVRTSALGEPVERIITFDIEKIVKDRVEELAVRSNQAPVSAHYTEITLWNLHKTLQGRTLGKIKEHLASIYRVFIGKGLVELSFDRDVLSYLEPKVLSAPFYKDSDADPVVWKKELDFDFGLGLRAHGFAALRETGSTSGAGFALFRRERLIQGGADEGYRPEAIFGKSNSFTYQRLFGELQLEGFEVSHTKDGFRWEEHEDVFLEYLKDELNKPPLRLLDQAEGYRARRRAEEAAQGADTAARRTAEAIQRDVPPVLERQLDALPDSERPPLSLPPAQPMASTREINVELHGHPWRILLELSADPGVGDWLTVSDRPDLPGPGGSRPVRQVAVRLSLAHPFMDRFAGSDPDRIEGILRVAAALGLAETAAREAGVQMAGTIRRNVNELLRTGLSGP
jgi:Histidine kinase-, DNA gyrase B-, and HSP90-like ATPase